VFHGWPGRRTHRLATGDEKSAEQNLNRKQELNRVFHSYIDNHDIYSSPRSAQTFEVECWTLGVGVGCFFLCFVDLLRKLSPG
jgi:hypothetical protein